MSAADHGYEPRRPDPDVEYRYWLDRALELSEENAQVRRWLLDLLLWIGARQELLDLAHCEIDRRWPEER